MLKNYYNLPAPAKLNLFLHVVGVRSDKKHLLESIFVLVDLADSISLEERKDSKVVLHGDFTWPEESDLCVRAAKLLQKTYSISRGVDITVKKKIPVGAGMGGGSSDAATTLIGLNKLWNINANRQKLAALGLTLGADVPFFINGENAFVEGIGEELSKLNIPIPEGYFIIWPGQEVSTKKIFSDIHLTRDTKSVKIRLLSDLSLDMSKELIGHNDLQPVAMRICPPIVQAIERLNAVGLQARMTGSGSAVFAMVDLADPPKLNDLPKNWKSFLTRGLKVHPLQSWC